MTNPYGGDDVETPPDADSGSALRKFANEQKARADAAEKRIKEIEAQLAARATGDIFNSLGVPEKVRKFYSGEPTEDAIKAWVAENADVFGLESGAQTPEETERNTDLENVAAAQALGQDRPGAMTRETMGQYRKDLLSRDKSTMNDLDEILRKMNVPDIPIQGPQF